jgi:hypothetical protein
MKWNLQNNFAGVFAIRKAEGLIITGKSARATPKQKSPLFRAGLNRYS